ncbi:MAG: hypothetical protein E4H13_01720, partial [Calditrichales bacterium]
MNKYLYIVLGFLLLAFGLVIGTPYILSLFELDQKLKEYVVAQLSEEGRAVINVNDINLKFGMLELSEIEYKNEGVRADFYIRGIEFDYNIFKLFTQIDAPHRAIDKIYLVEPRIVFKQPVETDTGRVVSNDTTGINILELLGQFENIDRIHLKNGSLYQQSDKGEIIALAQNLNGWIDSRDFNAISINADGDIFYGSDANFEMFCKVNLEDASFYLQLDLRNYDLRNAPLAKFNDRTRLDGGIIDCKLDVKGNQFDIDSISVNGFVSIDDAKVKIFQTTIDNLEIHARIDDNQLILNDGRGKIGDSQFAFSANVKNIFNPEVDGTIRSDRYALNIIAEYADLAGFKSDFASLTGTFFLSPQHLRVKANLMAPTVNFQDQEIDRLKMELVLDDDDLSVRNMSMNYMGFKIAIISRMNITSGLFWANISTHRSFGEHFFFDNLSRGNEYATLDINGDFHDKNANGSWRYNLSNPAGTLLAVEGSVGIKDSLFTFSNIQDDENDFLLTLQVANIFKDPKIDFGYIENLPFHMLTSRKWVTDLVGNYDVTGILSGTINNLNTTISIVDKELPQRSFKFTSSVTNLVEKTKEIEGEINFNKFKGDYRFTIGEDHLKGTIRSNHSLRGDIDINLKRAEQVKGKVILEEFAINKMLTDTTLSGYGEIDGLIQVSGNLDNPKTSAQLTGDKFIINEIGYYSFQLSLASDTSNLAIDTMRISVNNTNVLEGSLKFDYNSRLVDAQAVGEDIDTEYLIKTIVSENGFKSATGNYRFKINGPVSSPQIAGNVSLFNGEIENIPFDEVSFAISDSLAPGGSFLDIRNHFININDFLAVKGGQYHLEGKGNLPFFDDGAIDLQVQFDGDLLWLIPKWEDFFVDGASFTTIRLNVSGTPSRPIIREGRVKIERGELWLSDVAPHIENINGEIYIEKNSNYIVFKDINAEVDGEHLQINNVKELTTSDGKKLEPWYFKQLDLNFGILTLETAEKGLEIHIPSLMVEGESGKLSLSGKTPDEKFYFAGPVRNPYAWGKVKLSDSQITYPFPPGDGGKPTAAVRFLRRMDWDVEVYPGKDVEYVRTIPGIIGEVLTELTINPASEGLAFTGVLEKDSFTPVGNLGSSRGHIEYLDLSFRVENFGLIFNRGKIEPEVFGRAWTSVRDSVGAVPKTIYLELYAVNQATGTETRRARWEDFRFRLVSADPGVGETQEQVLASLGYSVDNVEDKAKKVGGAVTDNYLIRPLLRPLERSLEKYLGIDFVRFNARVAENLFSVSSQKANSPSGIYN